MSSLAAGKEPMLTRCGQSGFTLMEVLVAVAIILILIGAVMGVGGYVRTRANIDLTGGMLETLSTALAQYYDDFGDFPYDTDVNLNGILDPLEFDQAALETLLGGDIVANDVSIALPVTDTTSIALFYSLDRNPTSREIVDSIAVSLVTNKPVNNGTAIKLRPVGGAADGSNDIDLPRYIDPWKMSIRYDYLPGTAFPTLTSAGPDKIFDTPDDITSK